MVYSLAKASVIEFNLEKTELIYFLKGKNSDLGLALLNNTKIAPEKIVQ